MAPLMPATGLNTDTAKSLITGPNACSAVASPPRKSTIRKEAQDVRTIAGIVAITESASHPRALSRTSALRSPLPTCWPRAVGASDAIAVAIGGRIAPMSQLTLPHAAPRRE